MSSIWDPAGAGGAARYSQAMASSLGRHGSPVRRVVCPAEARNRLLAGRRSRGALGGPAYRVCRACPASLVYRADPATPVGRDDRACLGAMACPASTACRVCDRDRAIGVRARGGRDNRPCRHMR